MNNSITSGSRLLFFVVILTAQIIFNDLLTLSPFINVSMLPLLIMILPLKQNGAVSMISSFCLGLLIDLTTMNTIGINAGAATLTCFLRKPVFSLCFNISNKNSVPTIAETGIMKHILCLLYLSLVYFIFYTIGDGFAVHGMWLFLVKLLASCLISSLISIIFDISILNN